MTAFSRKNQAAPYLPDTFKIAQSVTAPVTAGGTRCGAGIGLTHALGDLHLPHYYGAERGHHRREVGVDEGLEGVALEPLGQITLHGVAHFIYMGATHDTSG